MTEKHCKICQKFVDIGQFRTCVNGKYQWTSSYCRQCEREKSRENGRKIKKKISSGDIDALVNKMFISIKNRSSCRKVDFNLTKDWLLEKVSNGSCEVTGLKFDVSRPSGFRANPMFPSVDRVDNSIGYTKDNCKMVVLVYNIAKNEWGVDVINSVAKAMAI